MFTQFRNVDTAFKHIKLFSIFFVLANIITSVFSSFIAYKLIKEKDQKVYVINNGKLLEARSTDRKSDLSVELRDHIKTFHQYFFTLTPEDEAIKASISKAIYLADESAKRQYDNLREAGYYSNIISANISQHIEVDSIKVNIEQYPYLFTCYATEKLVRSSSTLNRKLITKGRIRDINKITDNNPHGFLIQNWEIVENEDINANP